MNPQRGGADDAVAWGLSAAWPALLIAAVLYGSLIPFTIDVTALNLSNGFGLLGIGVHGATREDFLTNVLIYVPVGLSLMLCRRGGSGRWRAARIPAAVMIGTAVSILAETLQTGISARVASWTDVALNAIGTLLGAGLGAIRRTSGARAKASSLVVRSCSPARLITSESPQTPAGQVAGSSGISTSREVSDASAVGASSIGLASRR